MARHPAAPGGSGGGSSAASAAPAGSASAAKDSGERLAVDIIKKARPYGSFVNFVKAVEWKTKRNQHEAEHIAQSVDAYLAVEVSPLNDGMEIQLRRLVGVHLADECEDWEVCESIQFTPSSKSLLPRNEVDRAFKTAVQRKRLMTSVGKTSNAVSARRNDNNNWNKLNGGGYRPAQSNPSAASSANSAAAPPNARAVRTK